MSEENTSKKIARTNFYEQIEKKSLTPLWEVMQNLVLPEPKSPCIPKILKYDELNKNLIDLLNKINQDEES